MKNKISLFFNDYINFYFRGVLPDNGLKCALILFLGLFLPVAFFITAFCVAIYRYLNILFKKGN